MFVIEVPYFNLDKIYESYQAPRWIKLKESKYIIPHRDKALKIEQQKTRLIMSCSEQDFYDIWFNYFDLKTDYYDVPYIMGNGIHILNQDYFESYVFSRITTNLGYTKANIALNHIAQVCGIEHKQSMREAGRVTWYEWPTPEMILKNFDKLGRMGKINKWLNKLCEAIVNDEYDYTKSDNKLFRLLGMHDMTMLANYYVYLNIQRGNKWD